MKTRVITTSPAGHTVSSFDGELTDSEVLNVYYKYYERIDVFTTQETIPPCTYIRCYKNDAQASYEESELYQIKRE